MRITAGEIFRRGEDWREEEEERRGEEKRNKEKKNSPGGKKSTQGSINYCAAAKALYTLQSRSVSSELWESFPFKRDLCFVPYRIVDARLTVRLRRSSTDLCAIYSAGCVQSAPCQ